MVEIIEAAEKHIPGITALWMNFNYLNSSIEPYDTKTNNTIEKIENQTKHMINSGDALVLVAVDGTSVVGYSISAIMPPALKTGATGQIYDITVAADYRGRGITREMLEKTKEWFKGRHIRRIELNVIARKVVGTLFWQKHGFVEHGQVLSLDTGE